ncbi:MAG TPA: plastocyanin/azurin family copper-binding protein [Thermoleophilaceae bacterium]
MSRRVRQLALTLAALAAGTALALAVAAVGPVDAAPAPQTASFTAVDFAWTAAGEDNATTIAAGGTVTFGYPSGGSAHNVNFAGLSPTSCTQTAGPDVGAVPPLPAVPSGPGWSGACRFDTPGTYLFVCGLHSFMTGTVEVVDPTATGTTGTGTTTTGTTTTGTTTTGPTPTGTTTGPPGTVPADSAPPSDPTPSEPLPAPGGSPAPSARSRVSVARRQRGAILRGAVTTPSGRSQIAVTAFSSNRALAKRRPKHVRQVRVGSLSKRLTGIGKTSFALRLNVAAQRALHRRHRLVVDLRIVVTPLGGRAGATSVTVVLRDG